MYVCVSIYIYIYIYIYIDIDRYIDILHDEMNSVSENSSRVYYRSVCPTGMTTASARPSFSSTVSTSGQGQCDPTYSHTVVQWRKKPADVWLV